MVPEGNYIRVAGNAVSLSDAQASAADDVWKAMLSFVPMLAKVRKPDELAPGRVANLRTAVYELAPVLHDSLQSLDLASVHERLESVSNQLSQATAAREEQAVAKREAAEQRERDRNEQRLVDQAAREAEAKAAEQQRATRRKGKRGQ